MRKTKILTKKNQFILFLKLTEYLKEILADEEYYNTFDGLYKEAERVKVYGNIKYLTPALIAEWLRGLPIGTEFVTYKICVMVLDWLHLDSTQADKLGDGNCPYAESQTDIDNFYWATLGEIIYNEHFKTLYKAGKAGR